MFSPPVHCLPLLFMVIRRVAHCIGNLLNPYSVAVSRTIMVEILCPHCDEEIGLDDDAIGEFSCPHCDEDFTWEGLTSDATTTDLYDWKSFWIGFGIPNLFIILAWGSHLLLHEYNIRFNFLGIFNSGDVFGLFHIVSLLSWISILIYAISSKNKAMWKGTLVGLAAAPAFVIIGWLWYVEATGWSMRTI